MGRSIVAAVAGYLAVFAVVFIFMSLSWLVLGPEGAFQPGVWDITPLWAVLLVISGFVAAIAGGYAARRIDKDMRGAYILLGISVVLGIFFAIPVITGSGIQPLSTRPDELPMMDAMANGRQPIWVALLNPVIGAIGVLFGARLYHPKEA